MILSFVRSSSFMEDVHIFSAWLRTSRPRRRSRGSSARTSACGLVCLAAGAALLLAACSSSSSSLAAPGGQALKLQPTGAPPFSLPGHRGSFRARHASAFAPASALYTVRGNEILSPGGQPFVPYGITVFGLAKPDWESNIASDEAQIDATAQFWHGNTVRLQVAPPILLATSPYSAAYLTAIEQQVTTARGLGLNVILSAQYQYVAQVAMPDASTAQFWQVLAAKYKSDPGVWFDLFNEPQYSPTAADEQGFWNIWQHGGHGYVGMQNLVDLIRATGAQNVVLAEGLDGGDSLAGLPGHLLTGANVAYAVHPYFRGAYWATQQAWEANWGDLTGTVPVIADEWGEFQSAGGTCVNAAPTVVPSFLSYLSEHNVGLLAWALIPGVLIRGGDLDDPTAFNPGVAWKCAAIHAGLQQQGAGEVVRAFFAARSVQLSATG